ncbi:hypothetical protein TrLO_g8502 [Triparma laevis f. longispina]|uniref:SET domain-containing protein n=1 Tax=Triparma laevis f. longispina TaxID=1714387 RepID=A0A9W7F426_9STRA|nr:hypothetical protein TrLO_g8502 [Triparma laevis f. longispina]
MRSEGAIQPATKVVIISVIFIAGMISMGGIVGVLNSTVNNLRISNDYIHAFYSSQVSEKKIPFSSLLKKDFTLKEISVLAQCKVKYKKGMMPIPSSTDFAHLQATTTDYRDYLLYISNYSELLLCDVLLWAYSLDCPCPDCPGGSKTTVCLDLGGGGVTNDNRIDPTMDDNVEALGSEDTMQCMMGTFITVNKGIALRDIEVGEEVTMNYKDNESEAAYEELGLGKWGYARWYDSENYALGV